MAFNGSGVFQRLYNWVNDAAANIKIRADRMDNEMDGMATGLSTCITKDGQTTITANLPMAGFKHTGAADAANFTDYSSYGQLRKTSAYSATVGGTADVITLTYSPTFSAYVTGMVISWIASGANTTNVTVNVDTRGAKAVTKRGSTALIAGDIPSGALVQAQYDGTRFQLLNVNISGVTVSQGGTGATTFTDAGVMIGNGTGALQVTTAGTSGQVLTSNGAGVDPTFQTLSISTGLSNNGLKSGALYQGLGLFYSGTAGTFAANTMYFTPVYVGASTTITKIGVVVDTLEVGKTVRIGIYTALNGIPTSLILDAGTISTTTTGVKNITISQAVTNQVYFFAILSDTAGTAKLTVADNSYADICEFFQGNDATGTATIGRYTAAQAFGALPASAPAVTQQTTFPFLIHYGL